MSYIPNIGIPIKVIFEDDLVAVVDKPAGMPVYPVREDEISTLLNGLIARWPDAEPVHRLDNDTSGLLLVAKGRETFERLRAEFDERKILKQYAALVLGETPDEGVIETLIIHDPKNKKKMRVLGQGTRGKGQDAWTSYVTLKRYIGGRYSFLEVTIRTGVRHQIRVHMASIGHPLAGDRLYQNARQRERDRTGLRHQFLHSSKLGFHHPGSGKWMELSCPLASELENVLTKLGDI